MSGFLYYLPGNPGTSQQDLRDVGLGYAFESSAAKCEVLRGPEDCGSGLVLADDRKVATGRIRYQPDRQKWRNVPGTPAYVGMYLEAQPTPGQLMRVDALSGHKVELGDGNRWTIPTVRTWTEEGDDLRCFVQLPTKLELNGDGKWYRGTVKERYQGLMNVAEEWWDQRISADVDEDNRQMITLDDEVSAAVEGLKANYLLGAAEADLLGLLDEAAIVNILDAMIDVPGLVILQKKRPTVSDGEPLPVGHAG